MAHSYSIRGLSPSFLVFGLSLALHSCGVSEPGVVSQVQSAAELGGGLAISDAQKQAFADCLSIKTFSQDIITASARMACYGGDATTAKRRAVATLGCRLDECPQEIRFSREGVKVQLTLTAAAMGSSRNSQAWSQDHGPASDGILHLGVIVKPASLSKSVRCLAYTSMPGWIEYTTAVEREVARVCASW